MGRRIDIDVLKIAIAKQEEIINKPFFVLQYEPIIKKSNGFLSDIYDDNNDVLLSDNDIKKLEKDDCPLELLVYTSLLAIGNNDVDIDTLIRTLIDNGLGE